MMAVMTAQPPLPLTPRNARPVGAGHRVDHPVVGLDRRHRGVLARALDHIGGFAATIRVKAPMRP